MVQEKNRCISVRMRTWANHIFATQEKMSLLDEPPSRPCSPRTERYYFVPFIVELLQKGQYGIMISHYRQAELQRIRYGCDVSPLVFARMSQDTYSVPNIHQYRIEQSSSHVARIVTDRRLPQHIESYVHPHCQHCSDCCYILDLANQ